MRTLVRLAAPIVLAAALCACSARDGAQAADSAGLAGLSKADTAYLGQLYAAARKSGRTTVNVYSPNAPVDPGSNLGVLFQAFERAFPGIKVVGTRIGGAELAARLQGEIASGHQQADIIGGADDFIKTGWVAPFDPPLARLVPHDWRYPGNYYVSASLKQFGFVYNTRLVKPDEVPRSLDEVLSSKWRGKVTIGQPSGVEPVDGVFATLLDHHRIDVPALRRIAAFIPRGDRAPMASISSSWVAQGRFAIALWGTSSVARQLAERGAPVAVAAFPDTIVQPTGHALLKGAPSPDAAKLLLAWLFSPAGQRLYGSAVFEQGTVPGSRPPAGVPPITGSAVFENPAPGFSEHRGKIYRDIVAPIFGPAN